MISFVFLFLKFLLFIAGPRIASGRLLSRSPCNFVRDLDNGLYHEPGRLFRLPLARFFVKIDSFLAHSSLEIRFFFFYVVLFLFFYFFYKETRDSIFVSLA